MSSKLLSCVCVCGMHTCMCHQCVCVCDVCVVVEFPYISPDSLNIHSTPYFFFNTQITRLKRMFKASNSRLSSVSYYLPLQLRCYGHFCLCHVNNVTWTQVLFSKQISTKPTLWSHLLFIPLYCHLLVDSLGHLSVPVPEDYFMYLKFRINLEIVDIRDICILICF